MVSGVTGQNILCLVNGHIINLTLHWAKEMVVKMWDVNGLVNHNVVDLAGLGVIISKCTTNCGIGFVPRDGSYPSTTTGWL